MKNVLIRLFMMLGILVFAYGCSADDDADNSDFNDLILDNNVSEEWDGNGVPSWLRDRLFNFMMEETMWGSESSTIGPLQYVFKTNYKGNLVLIADYYHFGYNEYQTLSICFTRDGRRMKYNDDIKKCLEKESQLVWTNELGSEMRPVKVSDSGLPDVESLHWMQKEIDKICDEIKEPEQFLEYIMFGYVTFEDNTLGNIIQYHYKDKIQYSKDGNGHQAGMSRYKIYTRNGEIVDVPAEKTKFKELYTRSILICPL